jgi:hypothetical protein
MKNGKQDANFLRFPSPGGCPGELPRQESAAYSANRRIHRNAPEWRLLEGNSVTERLRVEITASSVSTRPRCHASDMPGSVTPLAGTRDANRSRDRKGAEALKHATVIMKRLAKHPAGCLRRRLSPIRGRFRSSPRTRRPADGGSSTIAHSTLIPLPSTEQTGSPAPSAAPAKHRPTHSLCTESHLWT